MKNKQLGIMTISDVHLGHNKNKTHHIIKKLIKVISHDNLSDVDLLVFVGDFFDRLLLLCSDSIPDVLDFLAYLLKTCEQTNTVLRFLEGTDSHDNHQLKSFLNLDKCIDIYPNFRYYDQVAIEYIESLGIYALYVPDSLDHDMDVIYNRVKEQLKLHKLDQVDVAFMHGCFKYQIPFDKGNVPMHDEKQYLDVVKHYISIGHHHTFSTYDRIIAQGSFDRLSHGQEEKKGYVKWYITPNTDERRYVFIENKEAMIFKQFDVKNEDYNQLVEKVKRLKMPDESALKIVASREHLIFENVRPFKLLFPGISIDFQYKKTPEEKKKLDTLIENQYKVERFLITPSNIERLVTDRLIAKDYTEQNTQEIITFFKEFF